MPLIEKLEKVKANSESLKVQCQHPMVGQNSAQQVLSLLVELTQALIDDANERKPPKKATKKATAKKKGR